MEADVTSNVLITLLCFPKKKGMVGFLIGEKGPSIFQVLQSEYFFLQFYQSANSTMQIATAAAESDC